MNPPVQAWERLWHWLQRGIALLLLLPASVLVLLAAVLIRFSSSGPMLIGEFREGRAGVCFMMYKLRTMVVNADEVLNHLLQANDLLRAEWHQYGRLSQDPRLAGRCARWIRQWSIDELPQLVHVMAGQMNLVGPRPLPLKVVANMRCEYRQCRNQVLPGMTGLWQVSGRSELSLDQMGQLDCEYVSRRTVWFDLLILVRTVRAVVSRHGAY